MTNKVLIFLLGFITCQVLSACRGGSSEPATILTSTEQVRALSAAEAARGYTVRLQGDITYDDPTSGLAVLQDKTGGVLLDIHALKGDAFPAGVQAIEGKTEYDGQKIRVKARQNTQLKGTENFVAVPAQLALEQKANWKNRDNLAYSLVELVGVVRATSLRQGRVSLKLAAGNETVIVSVLLWNNENNLPAALVDAVVKIRGVFVPSSDGDKLQEATQLYLNASSVDVTLERPPAPLQRAHPVAIARLPETISGPFTHRIYLKGRVTRQAPGKSFLLSDGNGEVEVHSHQIMNLNEGQEVDVFGFPQNCASRLSLADAQIYKAGEPPVADVFDPTYVQTVKKEPGKVITSIQQLHTLNPAEADLRYPLKIKAVVTVCEPEQYLMYVQDGTGETYVRVSPKAPRFLPGDEIEIQGVTDPCSYSPCIGKPTFTKLAGRKPLTAVPLDLTTISTGQQDCHLVEFEGKVRSVQTEEGQLHFGVEIGQRSYKVKLQGPWQSPLPQHLLDAKVRMKAVWQSRFTSRRQIVDVKFILPSLDYLQVIKPAPEITGEKLSVIPIRSLLQPHPNAVSSRFRVQGQVIAHLADGSLFMRDDSSALLVIPAGTEVFNQGDLINVTGYPIIENGKLLMRDATVQRIATGPAPLALESTAQQAIDADFNLQLIRLEAEFLGRVPKGEGYSYTMRSGPITFNAYLVEGAVPGHLLSLKPGSMVQITGINRIYFEGVRKGLWQDLQAQSFDLLLLSAEAVQVQHMPSWLTTEKAIGGFFLVLLGSAIVMTWSMVLRRRVAQQTAVIRQKLESEAALEQRFKNLFDNAQDMVYTHDQKGQILSFNKAAEKFTGYTAEDLGKLNLTNLLAPEFLTKAQAAIQQKSAIGDVTVYETAILTKDGRRVPLEVNTTLIGNGNEPPVILGIARDITTRKQIEAELQKAHDAAVQSAQMKSDFLANMSHEIRTPMNGVIGMAGLLLDTSLDAEQRDYAETVRSSADALLTIINDILDFSKIEAGKLELELIDFNLREAMEEAIELMAEKAEQKNLELTLCLAPEAPTGLHGDPGRIRQVLLNLLGNGLKFTEQGEVRVEITRVSDEEGGSEEGTDFLRFAVHDTGIGLTDKAQAHLFTPFTQADSSTTRKYGGTGLGLSICKQLVQLMGGQIGVQSQWGHGSTFWFTIPLVQAALPEDKVTNPEGLVGKRVLIVDDNTNSRQMLWQQTTAWGMSPSEAPDAATALQLIEQAQDATTPFDAILLDSLMPETDGLTFAQQILSNKRFLSIPIILMTSFTKRGQVDRARQIGVAACLTKPVRQTHLLKSLLNATGIGCLPELPAELIQSAANATTTPTLPSAHLLIVEDNPVNQKLIRRQVEKLGYRADLVANGVEALEAIALINYDLILMDCQMPVLDGYEATEQIRVQEVPGARVPILALTANALEYEQEKCLKVGMDDVLTKPISIEVLQSKLAHWLNVSAEAKWREELFAATVLRRRERVSEEPPLTDQITKRDATQVITH